MRDSKKLASLIYPFHFQTSSAFIMLLKSCRLLTVSYNVTQILHCSETSTECLYKFHNLKNHSLENHNWRDSKKLTSLIYPFYIQISSAFNMLLKSCKLLTVSYIVTQILHALETLAKGLYKIPLGWSRFSWMTTKSTVEARRKNELVEIIQGSIFCTQIYDSIKQTTH